MSSRCGAGYAMICQRYRKLGYYRQTILRALRRKTMLQYQPNMVLSTKEYTVVGKRPIRPDGAEKVTGQARYGADIQLPGMLYGKILRSPHSHARIKSIETR